MRFTLKLQASKAFAIPINYQYPLSAAIYKLLERGDSEYAAFLHEEGYGKGFKFFCFSDLSGSLRLQGDRLTGGAGQLSFDISFHLPDAAQHFIKGIFSAQHIEIADAKSRAGFIIQSVEALPNPFAGKKDNEFVSVQLVPASACVAGVTNEKGNYNFLSPEDKQFADVLLHNWREKIRTCFPHASLAGTVMSLEVVRAKYPTRSRLMTIKAGTPAETKIRGWLNFELKVTGEKRFVELLWNTGAGVYNSMGCGMVYKYGLL